MADLRSASTKVVDQPTGQPRLTLHHVGIVVPDLDEAVRFYCGAFGLSVISREADTDVDAVAIGLPGEAVRLRGAILGSGGPGDPDGARIELHEYLQPRGVAPRRVSDQGIGHICFAVDDIHAATAALTRHGVVFNAPPARIDSGGLEGRWWVYGRDPWGTVVELGQDPVPVSHALLGAESTLEAVGVAELVHSRVLLLDLTAVTHPDLWVTEAATALLARLRRDAGAPGGLGGRRTIVLALVPRPTSSELRVQGAAAVQSLRGIVQAVTREFAHRAAPINLVTAHPDAPEELDGTLAYLDADDSYVAGSTIDLTEGGLS